MQNLKSIKNKIGILIAVLVFGIAAVANAAVSGISDSAKTDSLKHMEALGIMGTSTEGSKIVKRDEFAKIIVTAAGLNDTASSLAGQSIYSDVKASDSISGYINTVVNKGFLTGMADRKFHPKDNLTYSQLATSIVKVLGYSDSDLSGIWPNNYLEKAKSLKLFDGMSIKAEDGVSGSALAVVLDRLLMTNVKKSGAQAANQTLMASVGSFSDVEVLGTPKTITKLASDQIMTDSGIYYIDTNPNELQVGNKYRVFVDPDTGRIARIYYSFKTTQTYAIQSVSASASSSSVTYMDQGIVKTLNLPDKVTYYYNGNKLNYDNLLANLHIASTIIFANNDNNIGVDYAIIVDPVYSKAEVASGVKAGDKTIGSIAVSSDEKILKSGDYIKLADIEDNDVVYQVSDLYNSIQYIYVVDSKLQGVLNNVLPNRLNPSSIQLDSKNYDLSKDMKFDKLTNSDSEYKIGDTVQVLTGYDGKIVDISKSIVIGAYSECTILANAKTMSALSDNQILTDKGIYYPEKNVPELKLGVYYKLYLSGNKILNAETEVNDTQTLVVTSINESQITYKAGSLTKTMTLPSNVTYYYQGAKQSYDSLKNVIQGDTTIIFANDNDQVGFDNAILIDPVYSKPEVAGMVAAGDVKIGSIAVAQDEKIVKNGDYINLKDIEKNDVVYQVSDMNGSNRYLYVTDSKTSGVLTAILPNRIYPTTIQIDNKSYDLSKDMKFDKLTSADSPYKIGDTVQALNGYDGKIVDISKDILIETTSECTILANSNTMNALGDDQVLTDKGIYYVGSGDSKIKLTLGVYYKLYLDGNKVLSAVEEKNDTQTLVVSSINGTQITYKADGKTKTMTLPNNITYYYQGAKQAYDTLKNVIQGDTTIIFANDNDQMGYDNAIVIDPVYSKPEIAGKINSSDVKIGSIEIAAGEKIVKNGDYINLKDIQKYDVVYQVSDMNGQNSYLYVTDSKTQGELTAILPNRIYPTSIQLDSKSYDLSKDMNFDKLTASDSSFKIGDTVQVLNGYDGKIVDIYKDIVIGTYSECTVLANSQTMNSLDDNQVLTDKGIYYLTDSKLTLKLGVYYKLYVLGNKILSAEKEYDETESMIVSSINGSEIAYKSGSATKTMTLPSNVTYYYQGAKQSYDALKNVIQGDTTIIFANDNDQMGYDNAIVIDPVYSKPEITTASSNTDSKIGSITIQQGEKIVKNGDYINQKDIQKDDVVYQVSALDGSNGYLYVTSTKTQGVLTAILPNRIYPTTIQIDNKNYDLSKDMDYDRIQNANSEYKIGDTVQIFSGYDSKIVEISKTAVVGSYSDCIILGNSTTLSTLNSNQILTDKGLYYLKDKKLALQVGMKYKLYISPDNYILSTSAAENTLNSYVVSNVSNAQVNYLDGGVTKTMTLPDNTVYYYQGAKQNYANVIGLLQGDSTIIFANNTDNTGYDYALIVDPIYSKPVIANNIKVGDKNIGGIDLSEWKTVIRNGDYISPYLITTGELVYEVSDIGNTNKYLLVIDGLVSGELTAILPNRISPKTIQIDNKNYDISKDFDLSKLTSKNSVFKIGDTVQISIGYDSKVANLDYPTGQDNANFAYVMSASTVYENGKPVYKVKIIKADGTTGTYNSYLDATNLKGLLVTFTNVNDDTLMLSQIYNQSYAEMTFNKDNLKFGDYYGTSNLRIFNVITNITGSEANVKVLNPSDLYSGLVASGKVLYMNHVGDFGDVNVMVLNDINEEAASYGLVTSATTVVTGSGPRKTTTYNYTILVNGKSYQWTTATDYAISALDIVGVDVSTGQVGTFYGVITEEPIATNIQALSGTKIKINNTVYQYRSDVKIYYRDSSGNITTPSIDDIDITQNYASVSVYLDKPVGYNGKVKAVVICAN